MPARPDDFGEQLRALALRLLHTDPVFRMRHQIAVQAALQGWPGTSRPPRSWDDVYAAERGVLGDATLDQVKMAAAVALAIAGTDPGSFPATPAPTWVGVVGPIDLPTGDQRFPAGRPV